MGSVRPRTGAALCLGALILTAGCRLAPAPASRPVAAARAVPAVAPASMPRPERAQLRRLVDPRPAPTRRPTLHDGDPWRMWKYDLLDFCPDLWDDTKRLANTRDALILLTAGGVSLAVRETIDDDVADNAMRHRNRWGTLQNWVGAVGNPAHHLAAAGAFYVLSLHTEDDKFYDFSKTLSRVVIINGLSVITLKGIADTETPNGVQYGWPSGHTSSSFAVAAVVDEYYGHKLGIPAYVLAGLVGWGRIDDTNHDLSDVVFGAAMGFVIGRTIASGRHVEFLGMDVVPYHDLTTRAHGIALRKNF